MPLSSQKLQSQIAARGMTIPGFIRLTGIKNSRIMQQLAGVLQPSMEELDLYCNVLGCSANDIWRPADYRLQNLGLGAKIFKEVHKHNEAALIKLFTGDQTGLPDETVPKAIAQEPEVEIQDEIDVPRPKAFGHGS